eukprot:5963317-Alexandrium_andersonii.AAC.1
MSASLVGSEMCIRDSGGIDRAGGDIRDPRENDALALAGQPVHEGAPVSYTHLTLPTICSV